MIRRPAQYRDGRLWPWFSEVLLRTHSYFPVEMRLWNGARFSTSPEPAHARIYDLPGRPYMFACVGHRSRRAPGCRSSVRFTPRRSIHPHGPLPATAAILIPELTRWGGLFIKYLRFGVASAIFKVPVLRDLHLWCGGRGRDAGAGMRVRGREALGREVSARAWRRARARRRWALEAA